MKFFKLTIAIRMQYALAISCVLMASPSVALPSEATINHAELSRTVLLNAAQNSNTLVAVSNQGDILLSNLDGQSWHHATAPASGPLTAISFSNNGHLGIAVGHRAMVLRTTDGGQNWTRSSVPIDNHSSFLDVVVLDDQRTIAVGAFGVYIQSNNGGLTWSKNEITKNDAHLNAIAKDTNNHLVIVGENGLIYRSSDMGLTWISVPSGIQASLLGVVSSKADRFTAFGVAGTVITSIDGGLTWNLVHTDTKNVLTGGVALADGSMVIVSAAGNTLLESASGLEFNTISSKVGLSYSSVLKSGKNGLLIFGVNGVNRLTLPEAKGN